MIIRNVTLCVLSLFAMSLCLLYWNNHPGDNSKDNIRIRAYQTSVNYMKEKAAYYNHKPKNSIQDDGFQLEHIIVDEHIKTIIYDTTALNLSLKQVNNFDPEDVSVARDEDRERMILVFKHDKDVKTLLAHDWKIESRCKTNDGFVFEDEFIDKSDIT